MFCCPTSGFFLMQVHMAVRQFQGAWYMTKFTYMQLYGSLIILHSEWPRLRGVLACPSVIGLRGHGIWQSWCICSYMYKAAYGGHGIWQCSCISCYEAVWGGHHISQSSCTCNYKAVQVSSVYVCVWMWGRHILWYMTKLMYMLL